VKRRFLKILRIAHAHKKTYGENSDFGKFGMRGSQIRPKKKKATFLNLIQLSTMIAKDEVIEFNDIIDKEYCSHRKDI
jgi:ribosomal protein L15